jgi:carbon storage regulator
MLVLSRRQGEKIIIGKNIQVEILKIKGEKIRVAIQAPDDVGIRRTELPAHPPNDAEPLQQQPMENHSVLLPSNPPPQLPEGPVFNNSPLGGFIKARVLRHTSVGPD